MAQRPSIFPVRVSALALAAICALLAACGDLTKVDDHELKPIQEMVDAQLPPGTPLSLVFQFAAARGYPMESAGRANALVVIIRHIDPQKLKPVTARVTFQFDKNDKLIKTDFVRTMNEPIPKAEPQTSPEPGTEPESGSKPPQ